MPAGRAGLPPPTIVGQRVKRGLRWRTHRRFEPEQRLDGAPRTPAQGDIRESALETLGQLDRDRIAGFLADLLTEDLRKRKLVAAIPERHERPTEGVTVDVPTDFHQTPCAEELRRPGHDDVGPAALRRALLPGWRRISCRACSSHSSDFTIFDRPRRTDSSGHGRPSLTAGLMTCDRGRRRAPAYRPNARYAVGLQAEWLSPLNNRTLTRDGEQIGSSGRLGHSVDVVSVAQIRAACARCSTSSRERPTRVAEFRRWCGPQEWNDSQRRDSLTAPSSRWSGSTSVAPASCAA